MIEGHRQIPLHERRETTERYPFVNPQGMDRHCHTYDGQGYQCTRLEGHEGRMHLVHFNTSDEEKRDLGITDRYVARIQWFSESADEQEEEDDAPEYEDEDDDDE